MNPDELIARASAQPEVEIHRMVSVHGPQLRKLLDGSRAVLLTDIIAHPDQTKELRAFRYRHILGPAASQSEINAWRHAQPHHQLPEDLIALLAKINGIHLWADISHGRSYYGVLPLVEWRTAETWEWNFLLEDQLKGHVVMSYHDNSDHFLLLDTGSATYYLIDGETGDRHQLGATVEEFLSSWWEKANELDPGRETAG